MRRREADRTAGWIEQRRNVSGMTMSVVTSTTKAIVLVENAHA